MFHFDSFEAACRSLAVEPIVFEVRNDSDIEQTIAGLGRKQGGLVIFPDAFMNVHRGIVIAAANREKVPSIYDTPSFAKEGGLIRYGPNFSEMNRRAASYVNRILRGEKPGDLPVELPTKYELVINLKTAKALGLDVSRDMLSIADEVIE